jgi:hypothetical protein
VLEVLEASAVFVFDVDDVVDADAERADFVS